MIDVVKFSWRNTHGYWIPVAWMTVPSEATDERLSSTCASLREYASNGRPGMTDFKVLDRITIPEELRLTGRSQWCLSNVVLHDKTANEYSAKEMLDAMVAVTA